MAVVTSQRAYLGRAEDVEHALFNGVVNRVNRQRLVDSAGVDGLLRHTKDHGGGFILGDYVTAYVLNCLHALGAVIAHAGQNDSNAHGAGIVGGAVEGEVGTGAISADARPIIKGNSSCGRDAHVVRARTYIELSGDHDLAGFRLFDPYLRDLLKLPAELRGEAARHVLHQDDRAGKVLGEIGNELHKRGGASGGGGHYHHGKLSTATRQGRSSSSGGTARAVFLK